jgi:high-affinity Fe2+/Pb2+ permease
MTTRVNSDTVGIAIVVGVLFGFVFGVVLAILITRGDIENELLRRVLKQYNQTTGLIEWKEGNVEKQDK